VSKTGGQAVTAPVRRENQPKIMPVSEELRDGSSATDFIGFRPVARKKPDRHLAPSVQRQRRISPSTLVN
jgi:hypothetical protein